MEFIGDIARKRGDPAILAVEAAKTTRAAEIGKKSGLFYVPRVVSFDETNGVLDLERIKHMATLHELARKDEYQVHDSFHMAGRALAVIHNQFSLPDAMKCNLPIEWMGSIKDNVFIHGDFTGANICFDETSNQLVIVDWSAAPLLGRTPTYGSRYFDIIWFIIFLACNVPKERFFSWDFRGMSNAFVSGYAKDYPEVVQRLTRDFAPLMHRYYRKLAWYLVKRRSFCRATRTLLFQLVIYPMVVCFRPCG